MARRVQQVAVLLLAGASLLGCQQSRRSSTPPILLIEDEHAGETATPWPLEPAESEQTGQKLAARREPAVLFVAYLATPHDVVDRMLKLAKVTRDDVVYDLGCGDGRIVVAAARKYGCRAVGYDLDSLRVLEARINVEKNRVSHLVTIEQKDVLKLDLQPATVITLYLSSELNARLIPALRKLRPGARIVSHDVPIGDIPPEKTIKMTSRADNREHTLSLWTCPLPPPAD